jgi:RimJ/RimL family protein N-acetyltransferase
MKLRPALPIDCYVLWLWANDPLTREASGDRPLIPWAEHRRWFSARIESPAAMVFVAEGPDAQPVGTVRFETTDGWLGAVVSYAVAPEARGRGFGRALLVEGLKAARDRHPDVRVVATVGASNAKSRRVFERLGWIEHVLDESRVVYRDGAEARV